MRYRADDEANIKKLFNEKKYDMLLNQLEEHHEIEKLKIYKLIIDLSKKFDKMKDNLSTVLLSELRTDTRRINSGYCQRCGEGPLYTGDSDIPDGYISCGVEHESLCDYCDHMVAKQRDE